MSPRQVKILEIKKNISNRKILAADFSFWTLKTRIRFAKKAKVFAKSHAIPVDIITLMKNKRVKSE